MALFAAWGRARGRRRPGLIALALLAVLSVSLYATYASRQDREPGKPYLATYDLFHYYLSSKYYQELGTDLLYVCAVTADADSSRPRMLKADAVRDLSTYTVLKRSWALTRAPECLSRFSERRWKAFKHDVAYFVRRLTEHERRGVVLDRGANASPLWLAMGGNLTRFVPVEYLHVATHIDTLLLLVAVGLTAWSFSAEAALVLLIFLTSSLSTRVPPIGSALFRYEWVSALIASVCLWRKERYAAGGAALAVATGARVFPFLLFAGVAARGLWRLLRERRLPRAELRFGAGFALVIGLLGGVAAYDFGIESFPRFKEKIALHADEENISIMRVGLTVAAAWRGELPKDGDAARVVLNEKRDLAARQEPWVKGASLAAVLAVLVVAGRRGLSDTAALLLGVALVPLVLQISYYYYVFLAFPVILHSAGLPRAGPALGLVILCWLNGIGLIANATEVNRYAILAPGSVLICLYAVGLIVAVAVAPSQPEPYDAAAREGARA